MEGEAIKLHVVIRCDLGMTKGKICAQAGHAVLGLYKDLQNIDPMAFAKWVSLDFGQETYQTNSNGDFFKVEEAARNFGIHSYVVRDAGRT